MRVLFAVVGVVGLVIVVAGAVNHAATVRLDYLLGTSGSFSLFWVAVGAAVALVVAAGAGVLLGRVSAGEARRKLETELDDTYRRLRETQAALPKPAAPAERQTAIAAAAFEPVTQVVTIRPEADTQVVAATPEPETRVVAPRAAAVAEAPAGGSEATAEPEAAAEVPADGSEATAAAVADAAEAGGVASAQATIAGARAAAPPDPAEPAHTEAVADDAAAFGEASGDTAASDAGPEEGPAGESAYSPRP